MFPSQETTYAESKYVANILTSMASGEPATPNSYPVPNFLTSMTSMTSGTGTTPTLTPTTLASLEQTFIELQSVPVDGSGANGGCEPHTQSGFVPPVVDPSSREQSMDSFESDPEWEPGCKRGRGDNGVLVMSGDAGQSSAPQRKYTRRSRNEKLTPEEEQRRRIRRERNKLAAAKCRQRRVDHTNCLVEETEKLEAERSDLENEIQSLQQERDQLEFLLQAHVPICKVDSQAGSFKIKAEPTDLSALTKTAATAACTTSQLSFAASSLPLSSVLSSSLSSSCSSSSSPSSSACSRPSSLPLQERQRHGGDLPVVVSCSATGVPLTTPSSGLFTYTSLDSLVEGSTGFTPLTAGPGVSCASQVHRSESESGSEAVSSPTLVSL